MDVGGFARHSGSEMLNNLIGTLQPEKEESFLMWMREAERLSRSRSIKSKALNKGTGMLKPRSNVSLPRGSDDIISWLPKQ